MSEPQKKFVIGTCDLVLADIIIDLASLPDQKSRELMALVERYTTKRGDKVKIDKKTFEEIFAPAIDNVPVSITPGGSSANALCTANLLMGDQSLSTNYLGFLAPGGFYSSMIARGFRDGKINLFPKEAPPAGIETAVSFVFVYGDRQRNIITYPGNADKFLTPEMVTQEFVDSVDALFMQGSMWKKFNPEVANRMFRMAEAAGKPVWLALPTNAFSPQEIDGAAKVLFEEVLSRAQLVMGNESEIRRMYKLDHELGIGEATKLMQRQFREYRDQTGIAREAMITSGSRGAMIITPDKLEHVKAAKLSPEDLAQGSTLGAGDGSFGFYIAGKVSGMDPRSAGEFAMKGAAKVCEVLGARLPNPIHVLSTILPFAKDGLMLAGGGRSVV